jgi:hypothetical protein
MEAVRLLSEENLLKRRKRKCARLIKSLLVPSKRNLGFKNLAGVLFYELKNRKVQIPPNALTQERLSERSRIKNVLALIKLPRLVNYRDSDFEQMVSKKADALKKRQPDIYARYYAENRKDEGCSVDHQALSGRHGDGTSVPPTQISKSDRQLQAANQKTSCGVSAGENRFPFPKITRLSSFPIPLK